VLLAAAVGAAKAKDASRGLVELVDRECDGE